MIQSGYYPCQKVRTRSNYRFKFIQTNVSFVLVEEEDEGDCGFDDNGDLNDEAEPFIIGAEADRPNGDVVDIPLTQGYEEFVRQNLEKFTAKAQLISSIADIGKRVQEWEDKITPILRYKAGLNKYEKFRSKALF